MTTPYRLKPQGPEGRGSETPSGRRRIYLFVLLAGAGALAVFVLTLCYRSPAVHYLAEESPGEWIVYPMSIDVHGHPAVQQTAVFSRDFSCPGVPGDATLRILACERPSVRINGRDIELTPPPGGNWKRQLQIEVGRYLKQGENRIFVTVLNSSGPPALWLSLAAGDWSLVSDRQWQVSLDGAAPRAAAPALAPIDPTKGDLLSGAEGTLESAAACRWTLLLYVVLSCAIVVGVIRFENGLTARFSFRVPWHWAALAIIVALWACLFWHNSTILTRFFGFDCPGHLDYIDYLQKRRAVPLADEGWEMFQPPLYYAVSAVALWCGGLSVENDAAVALLRFLSLLTWVVKIWLIMAILRLIFPEHSRPQQIGLLLAAFTPVQLYMFQYVANEPLMSMFGAGAIYLALRMMLLGDRSIRASVGLGLCLGAALLTKVSALLLIAVVSGALAAHLVVQRRYELRTWLQTLVAPLLICVAVSGWYYVHVWRHFGTPFVTNTNVESGFAHWSPPGYGYAGYFLHFGRTLTCPFFGGFYSAADGLYSTLWGDGMWGGAPVRITRPPWNYQLMAAGYLLALAPTVVVLTGSVVALARFVLRPSAEWLLLIGLAASLLGAEACTYLFHPSASAILARYGLNEIVVFCVLGGVGFDFLAARWRVVGFVLAVLLGAWAMTAYTSFWVPASAPDTLAWRAEVCYYNRGTELLRSGKLDEAIAEFRRALVLAPDLVKAHSNLGVALLRKRRIDEAITHFRRAIAIKPDYMEVRMSLGLALASRGELDDAIAQYRVAVNISPDNVPARITLADALAARGSRDEASRQYQKALESALAQRQEKMIQAIRVRMKRLANTSSPSPPDGK